ncbi:DNA polymerase/3'-5' exonuclease PolX [Candidatus Woesearchaeota archaeon]|nr:DNA polymerase/3'-5' exonuclease PolX [Candidatus Woesearchaeota archaeon]
MKNNEVAEIFDEIADIMEILQVNWKPKAYRKAALSLTGLSQNIDDIYKKSGIKGLEEIPGIGGGLAKKIIEYLTTGKISEYEKLKKKIPLSVEQMTHIRGLGPKKVWKLYKELKINNVEELKKACEKGLLQNLEGFGEKTEKEILESLALYKKGQERRLLGEVLPLAREIVEELKKLSEVKKIEIVGSLARMKETIKDIDLLIISLNPRKVMEYFVNLSQVEKIVARGELKSSVLLKQGINCDLRVFEEKNFGAAMQYFTGSTEHNVELRKIAIGQGYKLNEYGLFKGNKYVCGRTEEEIYDRLGLLRVPPEMRENTGEIKLKKLPDLINYGDIKGDLHMHTNWSDGQNTTEEMILAAKNSGHEYIAITDHSPGQRLANGLDEKRLLKHIEEIKELRKRITGIKILIGSEVDILKDGNLDYPDRLLKLLDWVNISIHSGFKMSEKEMTKRVLKALDNPFAKVWSHPTARSINKREPINVDLEKVFQKAKDRGLLLEVNSTPKRLDLKDSHARLAVEMGNKLIINTDSHAVAHLKGMEYGIAQARLGWIEKKDVVNTLSWKEFEKYVGKNG